MMKKFKVEQDIPVPKSGAGRPSKYPWRNMKAGETLFFDNVEQGKIGATAFRNYITYHKLPLRVETRMVENGLRLWAKTKTPKK